MKRKIGAFILSLVCVFSCVVLPATTTAFADVGRFSGSRSYGSSSSSRRSSSSSRNRTRSTRSSSSSSGSLGVDAIAPALLFLLVITATMLKKRKNGESGTAHFDPTPSNTADYYRSPMSAYKELDPNFDMGAFCNQASNLYVQMQNAWTKKDFTPMRPYFTDMLYSQLERQLSELIDAGQTNYVEQISVLSVEALGWRQDGGNDIITLRLKTRIIDYTTNDRTGKLVSGSKTIERFMTYEWDMSRPSGKTTKAADEGVSSANCPHCGAPISINASAKCVYCGSVISTDEGHTWAISAMRGISQR